MSTVTAERPDRRPDRRSPVDHGERAPGGVVRAGGRRSAEGAAGRAVGDGLVGRARPRGGDPAQRARGRRDRRGRRGWSGAAGACCASTRTPTPARGWAAAGTRWSSDRGSRRPCPDGCLHTGTGHGAPLRVTYRCPVSDAPVIPAAARPAPVVRDRRGAVVAVAVVVAAASFVGVFALWRVFVDTLAGQQVENAALQGALYGQTQLWRVAERVLDVVSVGFIAIVLVAAMLIAALRRRWSLAVQVAVLMIGANLTTRVLKNWVLVPARPGRGGQLRQHPAQRAHDGGGLGVGGPAPRRPAARAARGRRSSARATPRRRASRRSSGSGTGRRTSSRPCSSCSRGPRSPARWSR